MSNEINRTQVLQNICVKKMVKNDSWWIKPKDNQPSNKKSNPATKKNNPNILSITKKFEGSTQQTNGAPKNAPRKEAKVDTVCDTKLQPPTEQLTQNAKTQADKVLEENKKIEASAPIDKPNVDNKKKADEFSADNQVPIQPATAVKQKPEAAAPAEPAKTTPAKKTAAEDKEADAPPKPSNTDSNEFKALSKVGNCVPGDSAVGATSGSSVSAPKVQLKPPEIVVTRPEPEKVTRLKSEKKEASNQTVNAGEEKRHPKETKDDTVVLAVKTGVKSVPETPGEDSSRQAGVDSDMQVEPLSDSPAQPANKPPTESRGKKSSEPDKKVIVKALVDANAMPGEASPASDEVQPVSDTQSESPAAEAAVKSAERELVSAGPPHAQPVSGTRTQAVVKPAPEQRVEPKHEGAVEHVTALPVTEAVAPAPAAEAVQDNSAFRATELTDALDVKSQSNKSASKPEDSQQTVPEKPKQQNDKTNASNRFQKHEEKRNPTQTQYRPRCGKFSCSFCNQTIDGNIKLILDEPPVIIHPECLQCGVCAKTLGDLLTLIFLHDKVIHCKDCFQNAVNV